MSSAGARSKTDGVLNWVCLVYWFNAVIILPFNCNAIIVWSLEMFVVRQAFISMLATRGTVLCVDVLGTTLMVC